MKLKKYSWFWIRFSNDFQSRFPYIYFRIQQFNQSLAVNNYDKAQIKRASTKLMPT